MVHTSEHNRCKRPPKEKKRYVEEVQRKLLDFRMGEDLQDRSRKVEGTITQAIQNARQAEQAMRPKSQEAQSCLEALIVQKRASAKRAERAAGSKKIQKEPRKIKHKEKCQQIEQIISKCKGRKQIAHTYRAGTGGNA